MSLYAKRVKLQGMPSIVRWNLKKVPEHRTGRNNQYEIVDGELGAFSEFYMQSPTIITACRTGKYKDKTLRVFRNP